MQLLLCCCSYQSLALLLLQQEPSRVGTGRSSGEHTGTFLLCPCGQRARVHGRSLCGTCQQACSFRPARGGWVVDMVHARMSSFSWSLLFHFLLYKWTVEDYLL